MRVSERTLHNWEAGRVRIPYAAYKLIRILRGYELPGHAWKGYRLVGDTLWSPENLPFRASDARWWSLTVQMAQEYRRQSKARQAQRSAENGAAAKVENGRSAANHPKLPADNKSGISAGKGQNLPLLSGLVSLTTSQTELPHSRVIGHQKPIQKQDFNQSYNTTCNNHSLGPKWPHERYHPETQFAVTDATDRRSQSPSGSDWGLFERLYFVRLERTGEADASPNSQASSQSPNALACAFIGGQSGQERPLSLWQWSQSQAMSSRDNLASGGAL